MKTAAITLGIILILATVLPLLKHDAWWVRIFDFPRLQITILLIVTFAIYLGLMWDPTTAESIFLTILTLCVLYQCYMMFPYTRLASKQVQKSRQARDGSTISLLFANVLQDNDNAAKLREIIDQANPDIILTVETNDWWMGELNVYEESHPYLVRQPLDHEVGEAFLGRALDALLVGRVFRLRAIVEALAGQTQRAGCS